MDQRRPSDSLLDLGSLNALADPVRRRLYEFVAKTGRAIGRDEASAAIGVSRSLAAYHLDELAKRGLLEVDYRRLGGRGGRGGGRPAKLYERAKREFVARVPPRDYQLLAELLVQAAAEEEGAPQRLERVARDIGSRQGNALARPNDRDDSGAIEEALRIRGYEPIEAEPGALRLRNCPFHVIATAYPEIVCRLNLALIEGLLEGMGTRGANAVLAPRPGECCCVEIRTERAIDQRATRT
jgi:predicted ArsR family transcriptional regulator